MNRVLIIPTVLLIALGVAGFLLARGQARHQRDTVVFCNLAQVKTLDPGRMSWSQDIRTAMGLWEGLAAYDPQTLKPMPGVAESWDISADRKHYTFHLRRNARWSNGDPVVAGDFIFAWKRVLEPATAADYINLFYPIAGAEAYFNARDQKLPADFSTVGIHAPDNYTLTVDLAYRCDYFLDLVAFPTFYPLHEPSMRKFQSPADPTQYDARWVRPPDVVTNGPFKMVEWRFKRWVRLQPNEFYWDRPAVKAPEIMVTVIDDPSTALIAYQHGQADALSFVPQEFGDLLLQQRDQGRRNDVHFRPVFGTYYYLFNCQRPPFTDWRVRKALALAIDKERLVKNVTRMGQLPLTVLVPPDSIPGYASPAGLPMNVPEAQRLLAAAGFPGGKDFPVAELLFNKETTHEKVAQAIGQMWQENLGIQVRFRGLENSSFGSERRQHNFDIARGGWYGDYVDPTTWLDLALSTGENNDGQYKNPAYDDLLKQAASLSDKPAERLAVLQRAERLLVEDEFPFIPLYQYYDGYMYDENKLGGLDVNLRMLTQFKYLYKK